MSDSIEHTPSKPQEKEGAYCNKYGRIYIKINHLDDDFKTRLIHHGRTIEQAYLIAMEILDAVREAASRSQEKTE